MAGEETAHLVIRLSILAVTAGLSAFFSGSETALFSLSPDQVHRMQGARGALGAVARLRSRPKRLLTIVLFGNMVVNVVFFSVSFLLLVRYSEWLGPTSSMLLGFGSLLFIIIFCELLPKNLAVSFARPASRLAAIPLSIFQKIFWPFIFVLEKITDWITALLGQHLHPEPFIDAQELQMLVALSEKEGVLDRDVSEMIAEVLKLSDTALREIMIPRVEMQCYDLADPPEVLGDLFRRSKHTLIPVYEQSMDNMQGVIHAKDFLLRDPGMDLRRLMTTLPFLPETATVEDVLTQLREKHTRMAFVVDEYGAVEGLVTMEDILEEIVGEITDEFDELEAPPVERIDERRFRLRGDLSVREWHEAFEMETPEIPVDTVGGLVMVLLDHVPKAGDKVTYRNLELTVEETRGRRVVSVLLELTDEGTSGLQGRGRVQ